VVRASPPARAPWRGGLAAGGRRTGRAGLWEKIPRVPEDRKPRDGEPGRPSELLPGDGRGRDSARLFFDYYRLLDPPATRFFEALFEAPPDAQPVGAPAARFRPAVA